MNNRITKSRNLSTLQYLESLNKEWWICNLRRKIFPNPIDKKYYSRVSNLKKARIEEICERNGIQSIFTDAELMRELNKELSGHGGVPSFAGMTQTDLENYYNLDSDVRCFYGFGEDKKPIIKIGKVGMFTVLNPESISVYFADNTTEVLPVTRVSRIF